MPQVEEMAETFERINTLLADTASVLTASQAVSSPAFCVLVSWWLTACLCAARYQISCL